MAITITTQPQDFVGPLNGKATFHVDATGDGLTYMWQSNTSGNWTNTSFATSTTDTLEVTITAQREGKSFRCVITDANSDSVTSNEAMLHMSKLVDATQLDADLKSVADAIRSKSGGSSPLAFPAGFTGAIGGLNNATPASSTPLMDGTAAVGTSTDYARADHVHPSDTSKADIITEVTVSDSGDVTQNLDSGKIYHFTGSLTSLTITLSTAGRSPLQYHFDFDSGSTAPTVTLPNSVTMQGGTFTPAASKHYEVDILNGYGVYVEW